MASGCRVGSVGGNAQVEGVGVAEPPGDLPDDGGGGNGGEELEEKAVS